MIAMFVPMALTQYRRLFIRPSGRRFCSKKRYPGARPKERKRMSVEPVLQPAQGRQGVEFIYGVGVDIAHATPREVAGAAVVGIMGPAPDVIGRQGQDTDHTADPIADMAVGKERAVAAIVLDREEAQQEKRVENRNPESQPIADRKRPPSQRPEQDEGYQADPGLKNAAQVVWLSVA